MRKAMFIGMLLAAALIPGVAAAEASKLAGTWVLVENKLTQDGKTTDTFGPDPSGVWMFDGKGRFAIILTRADLPKFASNNRATGTADENRAVVQGSLAYFGTYSTEDDTATLTFQVEGATFSNWKGSVRKLQFKLAGDELRAASLTSSVGGKIELLLRRAR